VHLPTVWYDSKSLVERQEDHATHHPSDRASSSLQSSSFRIGGDRSSTLEDKVELVHFWSLHCGPCLGQMKALEQLVSRYDRDPGVEVVVISSDGSRDEVSRWLGDNGHHVPMLLDEDYRGRCGVDTWPTTLFVDRSGRVQFESVGSTPYLFEEYAWRVDALRESSPTSRP
jgi:thiol-disulfide isomerase/thioredoxin